MVAAPIILAGRGGGPKRFQTKIIEGDLSKKLNLGGPKILGGGPMNIIGKGGHTPLPFLRSPFLEIQDVLNFHRSIRKTE